MINPNRVKVWYHRFTDRARGTKAYRAGFDMPGTGWAKFSRRQFKTATEAVAYGERVVARWKKLYQAAVDAIVAAQPVPEAQP